MNSEVIYKIAITETDFQSGKKLFVEYSESLNTDLSFQGFEAELETINIQYNNPKGALLLAILNDQIIGCAGIRKFDDDIAELKRMFVQPDFRNNKIGLNLLNIAIKTALQLNYKKIKLDTLPDMKKAQLLYRKSGFYFIPPYRFNPVEGTVYMEKTID